MNKQLLFIPFLSLLATSCGGGHITTTPVVKNAPSAVLNAPKRLAQNDVANSTYCFNLGNTNWSRTTLSHLSYYYFVKDLPSAYPIVNNSKYLIDAYTNKGWGYVEALTQDQDFLVQPNSSRLFIRDDSCTSVAELKTKLQGKYIYYQTTATGENAYNTARDEGWQTGYQEGLDQGHEQGYEEGYNIGHDDGLNEANKMIVNGQYTGLSIFARRNYLEKRGEQVLGGQITPSNGTIDLIDTNANYTIHIKWAYNATEKITTFQDSGNTIIGELDWQYIANGAWSTSWFYLYDKELHYFAQPKTYATNGAIDTSFYPEVYIGSTFTGEDPNIYFAGGGNAYQMGFADGQTYTIHASETYQNVFTIFTPAFGAVASFFNMNIGPFKVWYFFAIPLIVTLLILVLRLVKH